MNTETKLPKGTTQEQWNKYESDLRIHIDYCNLIKPVREEFLTEQGFDIAMDLWNHTRFCDAPNKPGYHTANND